VTERLGRFSVVVVALCWAAVAPTASVSAQQAYRVQFDAERVVRFTSRAVIEEFDGVTDRIDGFVAINTPTLTAETGGDDTEFFFEVEDYPYAAFGGRIARAAPLSNGAFRVTVQGTLGIHGVERDRSVTCDLSPIGAGYRVQCSFQVLLTDHEIEVPKVMFLKLNNEIQLELDFRIEPVEDAR
jgi:polyisoprenoid-binding protein YceI